MSGYHVTPAARNDLQQIHDYIAQFDIDNALRFVERISERFNLLSNYPYLGVARPRFGKDHRSFVVPGSGYIIVYRPIKDGVEILRVVHGSQDLGRLFQQ